MCDCKRLSAHNCVDFCLQTTPTTSEVLRCRSASRCPPSSLTRQTLRRCDVVQSPCSPSLTWISLGDDHPWCRKPDGSLRSFSFTGTIFYSILSHFAHVQSSSSQYFTSTNHPVYDFYLHFFIEDLLQKPSSSSDLPLIGPRPWRHTPRLIVMHEIFRSLLKIFEYAAKQACKQLQCDKAKLSEPASVNGLHIHRPLG